MCNFLCCLKVKDDWALTKQVTRIFNGIGPLIALERKRKDKCHKWHHTIGGGLSVKALSPYILSITPKRIQHHHQWLFFFQSKKGV
mmetsp:Transcript_32011/g.48596  ORF Transcript_32011/g.48596 Transcript_32011/m.48596 type:complete len:86 (+) Transcript_32011:119-376(+)